MEWLKISTRDELVRIPVDDVIFIAADGNYSDVYTIGGSPHKMTFKIKYFDGVLQQFPHTPFVRVGRSLIVNRNFIYIINLPKQLLVLSDARFKNEHRLNVSREALRELKGEIEGKEEEK